MMLSSPKTNHKGDDVKVPGYVLCVGIICLTIIETMAIYKGIDGWYFGLVVAAVAGICGVALPEVVKKLRGE
jgi:hypothetical protein